MKRITLPEWAAIHYSGGKQPSRHTLRRWAREGRIQPKPTIDGRDYYVLETARKVDWPAETKRLVDRLA